MFIDEVKIEVIAGNGGDGCTAFRREKYVAMGGPFGGDGGRGSDIIFKVDTGLRTLIDLRYMKKIKGKKGENGTGKNMNGKDAEDIVIKVPQGTVISDFKTNLVIADLKEVDSEFIVAKGGRGGSSRCPARRGWSRSARCRWSRCPPPRATSPALRPSARRSRGTAGPGFRGR